MAKAARAFDYDEPRFAHSGGLEPKRVFVHDGKKGQITEHVALRGPDVFERLYKRGSLGSGTREDVAAGEHRYQAATSWAQDYERAGMSTVVVASYGGSVSPGVEAEPERRRAAKERFRRGHAAMTGRGASIVWGVVIENKELRDWPFPAAYTSERFREALDELADFYGVPT
jgi:hypothetical protein